MAYNNTQPLGSSARGGGGGWRALSLMNSMKKADTPAPATEDQKEAFKAGAGPVSEAGAKDFLSAQQRMNSILGLGRNTVTDAVNLKSAYGGYTAGTGTTAAPKGSSY